MIYRQCWSHLYQIERRRIAPTPEGELRLHRLERPLPWPDQVWPHREHIERYPDYAPIYHRLAAQLGVNPHQIVLGLGIEDLIRTLVMLSCDPGDGFAYTWPTCAMFELYARIFQTKDCRIPTHPRESLSIETIADTVVANECKLMLLPNPGQPVETFYHVDPELRYLAEVCRRKDCVLAIDEAYFGFGAPSALELINEFDNVVILRTFSKAFGAAGIRLGYAIGQEKVIHPMEAIRLSGEVTGQAIRAATRLLAFWPSVIEPGVKEIVAGREWLRQRLIADGYWAEGELANHVLVDMGTVSRAAEVVAELKARGINIRSNQPPLDTYIMVTTGPVDMMQMFYDVFTEAQQKAA